jgi:hypothetical protein
MKTCSYCGNNLSEDELENPLTDKDGDLMCDECYNDHYEFTCCLCQEHGDVAEQHKMVVVFDEEEAGVPTGVYRVIDPDYYLADLLGSGWLHDWALERIGDVSDKADGNGYACGHLCQNCQDKLNTEAKNQ